MGPGPSDVHPRVLAALARPTVGHLDPAFIGLMDDLQRLLQYAFRTENRATIPISAPGSAGMEACLLNLVEPGETVAVCRNGVFGGRMAQIVERAGAQVHFVDAPWGRAIDPQRLEDALKAHSEIRLVCFVHAETSTGARSDARALAEVARRYDCLTLVDAVTSLGGCALEVDAWGLDAVYSGSQKCLSCTPGLSPVTLSAAAIERVRAREQAPRTWFLDFELLMGYWAEAGEARPARRYHHTAPVNALYGLHEALLMLHEEGVEAAWQRHVLHHRALMSGLAALGLEPVVPEDERLPQLQVVKIPGGCDDGSIRRQLLEQHGLEIGGGLGDLAGKVWRIGLMGQAATRRNVLHCLAALESVLGDAQGGIAAANQVYGAS